MRHVIVPYERKAGQTLPRDQETWNYHLSSCRMAIEHTFGLLQGRFASLKGLPIQVDTQSDLARANIWIQCCVILHNFLMDRQEIDNFWDEEGGLEGRLAKLEQWRKSNAKHRAQFEQETGTSLDGLAYQQRDEQML